MTTHKMKPVAQPVLFNLGGKGYYLAAFTRENVEESFTHTEVKECLKEAGHIPANVNINRKDDEVLRNLGLTKQEGWVGLFGTISSHPDDAVRIAFLDQRGNFWRYHEAEGNGNLPHPVLCCK